MSTLVLLPAAFMAREMSFIVLAWRSAPLVEAIRAYQHDNGGPPPALAALVPDYLSAVPGTGMQAYPDYEYSVFRASSSREVHEDHPDSPAGADLLPRPEWELAVHCGEVLSFDRFVYWPSETYPRSLYGGATQPIGDWVYVDES